MLRDMELRPPPARTSGLPCESETATILGTAIAANPALYNKSPAPSSHFLGTTTAVEALCELRSLGNPPCPLWLQFPFDKTVQTLSYRPKAGNPKGPSAWLDPSSTVPQFLCQ